MNGPDAPNEDEADDPDLEDRLADYSIGAHLIYAAAAWEQAPQAVDVFTSLGQTHGAAVALVSDDGRIVRPR